MIPALSIQNERVLMGGRWLIERPLWLWRLLALAVLAGLSLFVLNDASMSINGVRYFWLDDDQMISMRYGRYLAEGQGLVWNEGERVEGFTNFLWTVIMAGVHLAGVPAAKTAVVIKLINLFLASWILWLSEQLLRELVPGEQMGVPFLWLVLALCLDVVYWSANGFETTLLTAVFLLVCVRLLRKSRLELLTFTLMGLLPLIRTDAYAIWASAALLAIGMNRNLKRVLALLCVSAVLPLGYLLWRHGYYGSWLPNTYYLKVYGMPLPLRRGLGYLAIFIRNYSVPIVVSGLGIILFRRRQMVLLAAGLILGMGYVLLVGDDIFPYSRFLAYEVPVVLVLALTAVFQITSQARPRFLLLIVLSVATLSHVGAFRLTKLTSTNGEPERGILAGVLIDEFTDKDTTIAVSAAGVIPYFANRKTIDMLGKSDPYIARLAPIPGLSVGHNKYNFDYSLGLEPDLIVTELSEKSVAEWSRLAQGELSLSYRRQHYVALITNDLFKSNYAQKPVDLPILRQRTMIYANEVGGVRSNINAWREPIVLP